MMLAPDDRRDFRPFAAGSHWIWSGEGTHLREQTAVNGAYQVRLFRKTFSLSKLPASFLAAITADSRYDFFLNGRRLGRGPAKGDVVHQFFDTYDLTAGLREGRNVLAIRVVDYSPVKCYPPLQGAPGSMMTYHGGLAFDGLMEGQRVVSDQSWRVRTDPSFTFGPDPGTPGGYVGYFEHWHADEAELDWSEPDYDDQAWGHAMEMYPVERLKDRRDSAGPYGLVPRMIPPLGSGAAVNFADVFLPGGTEAPAAVRDWILHGRPLQLPANSTQSFILDAGRLETGFPKLNFTGGQGASITLTYAEALRLSQKVDSPWSLRAEGDLASVAVGEVDYDEIWTFDRRGRIHGNRDVVWADGRAAGFEPTHWRTFRYLGLEVKTGSKPIELAPPTFQAWAYPLEVKTSVETGRASDRSLWEKSFRTLQLCCHETFEDCPYYEQMQYAGDSIITSRLMLYLTGDGRLTRQALLQFAWSLTAEGITASRYPSSTAQVIPSWSLHWITILHGYVLLTGDREFARPLLRVAAAVLSWFRGFADADGLPARLPYWNCVDWTPGWQRGSPPGWDSGATCVISSQFVQALRETADLQEWCAFPAEATPLRAEAERLARTIDRRFWSEAEGCYFDSDRGPEKSTLGNAWAVCAGIVPREKYDQVARWLDTWSPANASYFGMYFIFRARRLLGSNTWWEHLHPWEKIRETGLTTWPEDTAFWRSLCHAWSAHPITEYIEGTLGLQITAPGWTEIVLRPNLGPLPEFTFNLFTPLGMLTGKLAQEGKGLRYEVRKPKGMAISLFLGGKSILLEAGREMANGVLAG